MTVESEESLLSAGTDSSAEKKADSIDSRPVTCCHPNHWPYLITLLFLTCYVELICYYCCDSPGGLEDTIIKVMGIDTTQYNLLFLVTTWPNIVISVIGGVIADRILGPRSSFMVMTLLLLLGQLVWSVGSFLNYFWVVLFGRFIIGIAATLSPAICTMFFISWFGKEYLTLAVSTGGTAARLGAAAALALPQFIYQQLYYFTDPLYRLGATVLVGAGLVLTGLMATIVVVLMDKYREKVLQKKKMEMSKIECSDLKQFDGLFWLATSITLYYSLVNAFTGIGQVFYIQKYGLSLEEASIANSFVFSATMLATPIMGCIVNATGHHILWTMVAVSSGLLVHVVLLFSNPGLHYMPYVTSILYSVSYTIMTPAYWGIPGLIVEGNQIATAYGIIGSSFNLFWGLLSIISGFIIDKNGYFVLEAMYSLLSFLVLMISVLVLMVDFVSVRSVVNAPGTWNCLHKINEKD
ncbi:PREDICTED: major facilitator superfamily domain-containing protein 1-like [Amphimedon queenslandica]|uniref:Lysosomal dipeptide transporter MFSD1 n=2 Tax=Amphimedon queenslandica TaxID=400682 RepID=A0AAN0J4I6_AMPQE|nr:PREDICTED: major facilitator superfamily domain-containing protein 1-like [Amphimedon queenslandica]|eukprot:XP_019851628.1 PREDICTED: major facilitator superfamily domain-containing protein 1-like [Amphimedon queenslandica]